MKTQGIETGVYYPTPIHKLRSFNFADLDLPETNLAAQEVVSIPIHPNLHFSEYKRVAESINIYTEKEL
jgi:dTDP-4-amino-4,6-dideoxygalactose transaminase